MKPEALAAFYRDALGKAGWTATTEKPFRIDFPDMRIFRHDAKRGIVPEDPTLRPASEAGQFEPEVEEEEEDFRAPRGDIKAEDVFGKSTYVADDEEDDED